MTMNEEEYNNLWTKLGLGKLRGHWFFKGIWRGLRVAVVAGLLGIADGTLGILTATGLPQSVVLIAAPVVEKWLRAGIKKLAF